MNSTIFSGITLHIVLSVIAYVLLACAMLHALLLMWQDYQLKHKQLNGLTKYLPPLQTMEKTLFLLLCSGWISLTCSLISGGIFLDHIQLKEFAYKTIFACLAWLTFAILLAARYKKGWRGITAIRWTLSGCGLLVLAYLGSKFV